MIAMGSAAPAAKSVLKRADIMRCRPPAWPVANRPSISSMTELLQGALLNYLGHSSALSTLLEQLRGYAQ